MKNILLTKKIMMKWNPKNINWYRNRGYKFTKYKDEFEIDINDLSNQSNIYVDVKCDDCNCKNPYLKIRWHNYRNHVKENGKYYCLPCAARSYRSDTFRDVLLKKGKSFEQWCIENNRQDVLDRWDYELNDYKPTEVSYSSHIKIYLKCEKGIHKSEIKSLHSFIGGEGSISCRQCNSFAQWGIDNLGEDFLDKYWDYDKNTLNPWEISKSSNKPKIWIKCQEVNYHGSYDIICNSFSSGRRCPYCGNKGGKVHELDSLGKSNPEVLEIWSDKNKKTPFEYAPKSSVKVWWKCFDNIHKDYLRSISNSYLCNYRCPNCQFSRGEERIESYLIKNIIVYETQKEFNRLFGINNGLLSYDFYLPSYNLLIEYQGMQHEKYIPGFHESKKDFERQVEHDRRKREYAKNNNIELLEIWYWDFDRIEEILENNLKEMK